MSIADQKAELRERMLNVRRRERARLGPEAERAMGRLLAHSDLIANEAVVVSGFLPIGHELDTRIMLEDFANPFVLPVMVGKGRALVFRQWQEGDPMVDRAWGIREPAATAPVRRPDVLLVPLLAVDRHGYRLGYGGGFYDRTLAELRADGATVAIGVAFDGQQVDAVPHDSYDQTVDFVLTPTTLTHCASASNSGH